MLLINRKGRWTTYYLNEKYEINSEQLEIADIPYSEIEFKNETDKRIYEYIQVNGFITTYQVLNITNIRTISGATAALRRMAKAGLINKIRQGRQFIYQLK